MGGNSKGHRNGDMSPFALSHQYCFYNGNPILGKMHFILNHNPQISLVQQSDERLDLPDNSFGGGHGFVIASDAAKWNLITHTLCNYFLWKLDIDTGSWIPSTALYRYIDNNGDRFISARIIAHVLTSSRTWHLKHCRWKITQSHEFAYMNILNDTFQVIS